MMASDRLLHDGPGSAVGFRCIWRLVWPFVYSRKEPMSSRGCFMELGSGLLALRFQEVKAI